jgi:DNA repair protein RecN (Recombination protein N)
MLTQLYIRNFTLIDTLDIPFHAGFSVITGETGAGKSIILGAISLLLGQRADTKSIKQGKDKCVVEAHFDLSKYGMEAFFTNNDIELDAHDTIIRREITAAGKSRSFINDTPVSLGVLKELGEKLMDIHSQHQNLLLNKQDFQLSVVDIIANNADLLQQYQQVYADYQHAVQHLKQLQQEIADNQKNADFLQFQYDELLNAKLIDGEQEELEQKSDTMSHVEDIKTALYEADNALSSEESGIVQNLKTALYSIQGITQVLPAAQALSQRLDSSFIELKDIAQEISQLLENIDFDPAQLDTITTRLDTLYSLEKKFNCETVAQLITLRDDFKHQLDQISNSDEALADAENDVKQKQSIAEKRANLLTVIRQKTAQLIEQEMLQRLITLGMPNVRFQVDIQRQPLSTTGQDKLSFLFSANKNTALQPVSQVASGGEIARVMLSLKAMISGAVKLPTIIFDEIDTGVSGKIAEKMAEIMLEMGDHGRQVISITHLPQIAAYGTHHYRVSKTDTAEGTTSNMVLLSQEERIREIAQMLSGSDITDAAINNAKELLKLHQA